MKIMIMTLLDLSRDLNGVVVSAKAQIELLQRKGWDVAVVTPYSNPTKSLHKVLYCSSAVFRKTRWSWLTLFNLAMKAIILASSLLKANLHERVFHAHDVLSAGVLLIVTRGRQKVFLQNHFHSYPWDEFHQAGLVKKNSPSYRILKAGFLKILDHRRLIHLPISKDNQKLLKRLHSGEPQIGGVLYPSISPAKSKVTSGHNYMINVGSIDARKNQIILVDVLKELERLGAHIPLILVGPIDSNEMERIQGRKRQLALRSEIIFTGSLTHEETRKMIADARIYIHTAFRESFGRTLVEAMAGKTPVVALHYPAVHEILNSSAIMPRDWKPAEIAHFIATLLISRQTLDKIQAEQYVHFKQYFSESVVYKNYLNTLHSQGAYHVR